MSRSPQPATSTTLGWAADGHAAQERIDKLELPTVPEQLKIHLVVRYHGCFKQFRLRCSTHLLVGGAVSRLALVVSGSLLGRCEDQSNDEPRPS